MDKSSLDAYSARDKGMTYLTKGKEIFNAAKNVNDKEAGYNLYKKGLEMLMSYLKGTRSASSQCSPYFSKPKRTWKSGTRLKRT